MAGEHLVEPAQPHGHDRDAEAGGDHPNAGLEFRNFS